MNFAELLPKAAPWVENLVHVWPAPIIKPQFAWWEVGHIISLFMLSGALIAINLRLLGAGLTRESASTIERTLRPWLAIGVFGALGTGLLLGMTNAEKLYDSTAFLVKMIAMVAAIVFTYAVTTPLAKKDGEVSPAVRNWLIVSLAVWLLSLLLFSMTGGINPGTIHVIMAFGLLIFVSTQGQVRKSFILGMIAILAAQQFVTHVAIPADNYKLLDPVNKGITTIEAIWILGFGAYQVLGPASRVAGQAGSVVRLAAYASLLMWVTVGAAGRWIAFAV